MDTVSAWDQCGIGDGMPCSRVAAAPSNITADHGHRWWAVRQPEPTRANCRVHRGKSRLYSRQQIDGGSGIVSGWLNISRTQSCNVIPHLIPVPT